MPRSTFLLGPLALLAAIVLRLPAAAQPVFAQPVVIGGVVQPGVPPAPAVSDDEALKEAGLSAADGAQLVGYLKQRTVSDADQGKIQELIKQFTADKFDDRLAAAAAVEKYGPAAIGPLKTAERDPDPEVSYRATQVLKKLEKVSHATVAAAAVRAVVRLKPPGAAAALLGFLPLADSDALGEEIRGALVALAVRDGKADPAVVAGLTDPFPVRRGACYVALVEGGPPGERVRAKDAYPQVKEAVRKDTDPEAKFRGLWALALTTREKEFIPDLIALVPQLPRGRLWQVEELLLQLAGEHPEGGRFGKSPEALAKARDAWAAWWAKAGGATDLAKLAFKPRLQGFTDLVMFDQSGFGRSAVSSLGPDLTEKWRMVSANFHPFDARVQADGKIVVVEQNFGRVTERDAAGAIRKTVPLNQPVGVESLADGGRVYVCRGMVIEHDKDGKQTNLYTRPNNQFDILAGRRLPGGDTVIVTNSPNGANCFRLDAKLKEVGKPLTLGRLQNQFMVGLDVVGEDKLLVCEFDKVAEYDMKTEKAVWKHATPQPTSVQRLPNGNTLVASLTANKVVEVDPAGEVVWEYQAKDGLRIARAYRR